MTIVSSLFRGKQTAEEILEPTPMTKLCRRVFKNHSFLIGALILIVIIIMAVLAPFIAPFDPYDQDLSRRLINPFWHDKKTADLLKGSEVDFVKELIGEQFKITNPQTKSSCGCGVSFSL